MESATPASAHATMMSMSGTPMVHAASDSAANLRTVAQRASEDRWVQMLTTADGGRGRPPMPWMNTAQMNEQDLRAMYRYIHSPGAAGIAAPRAAAPGAMPTTPYINFVPVPPGSGH